MPLLEQVTVTHVWTPFPVEAFAEVAVCLPSHVFLPKNVELFVSSLEDYLVLLEYFEFEGTQVHQLRQGDVHMIGDLNIEVLSPAPTVVKFNLIEELAFGQMKKMIKPSSGKLPSWIIWTDFPTERVSF